LADIIALREPSYRQTTLDELWAEAETLGKVGVDDWSGEYKATISFTTRSGSHIRASGKHKSPAVALGMAINEARGFGAGSLP
jgi:hypothetical protein